MKKHIITFIFFVCLGLILGWYKQERKARKLREELMELEARKADLIRRARQWRWNWRTEQWDSLFNPSEEDSEES